MSRKIGRFEILSELAKSDSGCVYKANDPESGQTIALKTIQLEVFGEHAEQVVQRLLQEVEATKGLSSSNLTQIFGAGDIENQFCAAMEYVQGNSIATMLARKEGFSIWDLLDISRQVCQAFDLAHEHNVFHFSLEPAKIMVTWDGTVKILSFGISSTGYVAAQSVGPIPSVLHYMSPEQIGGEMLDARSNLFTWGAILYEMVTDQKAFDGPDADSVRSKILEEMPAPPTQLNPRVSAIASQVIMKALAKDPAARYQSGRELVNDLERCRESTGKSAQKPANPPKGIVAPEKARAAAAAKFAAPPPERKPASDAPPEFAVREVEEQTAASPSRETVDRRAEGVVAKQASTTEKRAPAPQKASAAAAGWSGSGSSTSRARSAQLDPSTQYMGSGDQPSAEATEHLDAGMSAGVAEPPAAPKITVDPLMAEGNGDSGQGVSFSELNELPPLKEVYIAPPPPKQEETAEPEQPLPSIVLRSGSQPEKPKIQPREVAEKAIKEIKSVPPKLFLYSVAGAVALILIIAAAVAWRSYSQNTDEEGHVPAPAAAAKNEAKSEPAPEPAQTATPAPAPEPTQQAEVPGPAPEPAPSKPAHMPAGKARNPRNAKKSAPSSAPTIIPGQLSVDSAPEGAQIQVDGRGDPNWVTPYNLAGLTPGQHTVVVSKSGYGQENRTIEVASGSKSFLSVHLATLSSSVMVGSEPAGAAIYLDGKDTQRVTPAQITLDKGTHTILVRKVGYLDETTSATAQPGQTYHFAPTLRQLGNADDIKTVGKVRKLFGGKNAQAGMGKVTIKTTPKGAQIAVNRRMLDKNSPVEFLLNPGNYIVDITLTGYKPVQKVIAVEQDGTVSIDETLQAQ